jgi:hypothetical protein
VPALPSSDRVLLVGCSRRKTSAAAPARELFRGETFRRARAHAVASGRPWFVLSAKFGLLDPDDVVGPYDVYLPNQPAAYREVWGEWVVAQLCTRRPLAGVIVEVHAGEAYCAPLRTPLQRVGATVETPLAGLRQGERLAWYGNVPEPPVEAAPDIQHLLDERNAMPPGEFLARGRTAANAPGLYSWWVDETGSHDLSAGLGHHLPAGLIYAGRAGGVRPNGVNSTNTLWGRVATMHLGGNRDFSTFRLTLAACLSRPDGPPITEAALTAWMHQHLRIATLPLPPEAVTAGEARLLALTDPPLNLRDVPPTPLRSTLSRLRSSLKGR